jgi:hypothetical protein
VSAPSPPRPGRGEPPEPDAIELPAPTAWPLVVALGVTMIFAGLVTHGIVSVVGAILAVVGGGGWWWEVLPREHVEHVPLRPPAERPAPIVVSPAAVRPLIAGEAGHRMRLPVEVQPYSAGLVGGLVGGAAMAVVACSYGVLFQGSPWYPINLLSAAAMPAMARADVETLRRFDASALLIGVIVHGVLSILAGLLYAVILPMLPRRHMLWGGVVAPLLWTGLVWAVLGIVNPALHQRVDWAWFIASQIAFGLAAGFVVARAQPIATMQTWPLAARAGVAATGMERPRGHR